jgi:hypothetical protein
MEKLSLYTIAESLKNLEEMSENDESLAPYLDSVEMQLEAKVDNVVKFRQGLIASSEAIDIEIERLTKMKRSRQNLADRLKEYIGTSMKNNGIEKIDTGLFKLSFLKSETVLVDDSQLDEKYIVTKITKQADKIAIKKALKAGEIVSGASLETHQNLQIK